ncbi:cell surface hyaluronidase-like [Pecten maximus]|uniref:cell surface hyaluronidase-like n=1 Tax=Pecten maximus TaxID=6579 RepID=UPI001458412F|nr:cell surface hyaluronidase-like [Pecten maximus]
MRVNCYLRTVTVALFLTSAQASCPHEDPALLKWSEPSTWPNNQVPSLGDDVYVSGDVLLDVSPPELRSVNVEAGATLVWSPNGDYHVTTKFIHVKGAFHIGSETCPFEANARITLTGDRKEYSMPNFGAKFIGVDNGATLEIHGRKKLGWTKLEQTVPRLNKTNGLVYTSLDVGRRQNREGLGMYVFNPDGTLFRLEILSTSSKMIGDADLIINKVINFLTGTPDGKVILIAVQHTLVTRPQTHDLSKIFDAIETVAGIANGDSKIRDVGPLDAYALATVMGDPSSTCESMSHMSHLKQTATASVNVGDLTMIATSRTKAISAKWNDLIEFQVVEKSASSIILNLIDDVTTWKEGDRLLLTSTDYDMEKAEETTVLGCNECTDKQVKVSLLPKFMHFGEIDTNIDMRGEVALLSRNIIIEGAVNSFCPSVNENCKTYNYDTFGGHIKAIKGFVNMHIEGAELRNMGKQTDLGNYPIHFHMCEDVDGDDYPNPPYIRENAIHHTFARCLTIHGTHGVMVMDNVAYESIGHCYFLEDGGEKRTVFDGNLGANTRPGSLIPLDRRPTTFWITNPQTTFRNNVAAGSMGLGIWFIFPDLPLGPSADKGFMKMFEARYTAITEFTNNVAHSNKNGLFIDDRIDLVTEEIDSCNRYEPKEDPSDRSSADKNVIIDRLTAYNNRDNAWLRGGYITLSKASLGGSLTSMLFARNSRQEQFMEKSVIVGETRNTGDPTRANGKDGWKNFPRSIPNTNNYNFPLQGFGFYDGPVFISDSFFDKYTDNEVRKAGAIGFKRFNSASSSTLSGAANIHFGFPDGLSGNRAYDGNSSVFGFGDLDGDLAATFRDNDGSVTTIPGSTVVKPFSFVTTPDCIMKSAWNLMICPYKYMTLRCQDTSPAKTDMRVIFIRDDLPDSPWHSTESHFRAYPLIGGGKYSYSIYWPEKAPSEFMLIPKDLEKGHPVRVGVCLPLDATINLKSWYPKRAVGLSQWTEVDSVQDIDDDTVGGQYYRNRTSGMLYVKLFTNEVRKEGDTNPCAGNKCMVIKVYVNATDMSTDHCRERDIPTPPAKRSVSTKRGTDNLSFDTYYNGPEPDWGAGSTVPFTSRDAIDGGYGTWSQWGSCRTDLTSVRTRTCNDPIPRNGGASCSGPRTETMDCAPQSPQPPTDEHNVMPVVPGGLVDGDLQL